MGRNWKGIAAVLATVLLAACTPASDAGTADAAPATLRVEPPCWWTGMKTPLQLMVHDEGIGACQVRFEGLKSVKVSAVHRGDSPNYLFIDVQIGRNACPGTGRLVFTAGRTVLLCAV